MGHEFLRGCHSKPPTLADNLFKEENENVLIERLHCLYPRRQKTQSPLGAGMNGGKITHANYI